MAETSTIARPYAKAIFAEGLSDNTLNSWRVLLNTLAIALVIPKVKSFVANPEVNREDEVELLSSLIPAINIQTIDDKAKNLIKVLANNKRLLLLPDINAHFVSMCREHEKTQHVDVISFKPMTSAQEKALITKLKAKLKRDIELKVELDESILGGVIIRADDLVLDLSVRNQLNRLNTDLMA